MGITSQYPFDGKIESLEGTVLFDCLQSILRACRSIPADRWKKRRNTNLIKPYQKTEKFGN